MTDRLRLQVSVLLLLGASFACSKDSPNATSAERSPTLSASGASSSRSDEHRRNAVRVAMLDQCDPTDPAWNPTGGCLQRRGDVNFATFNAFARSPLVVGFVGHPAWTFDPTYAAAGAGQQLLVTNEGGRIHTFTEVANFGGGRVAGLNAGSTPAPECATAINIPAGGTALVMPNHVGTTRYQCCIHPWMRMVLQTKSSGDDDVD